MKNTVKITSKLVLILLISILNLPVAPGAYFPEKKMVLTGDSWSFLMCMNNSFHYVFVKNNINNAKINHCFQTTKTGAKAFSWTSEKAHRSLIHNLTKNPDTQIVYLSLGGNDFMALWNKNMTDEQEGLVFTSIRNNIQKIVDQIISLAPDARVLISGYDFGNFVKYTKIGTYKRIFANMGYPTPYELNSGLARFTTEIANLSNNKNVFFIHHLGLMLYHFGQSKYGIQHHTTPPPYSISPESAPGSVNSPLDFENSTSAMFHLPLLFHDPFHLTNLGFQYVAEHSTQMYLKAWLQK